MITVTFYYRPDCDECDKVLLQLSELQSRYEHQVVKIDVRTDPALLSRYGATVPVVMVGPYQLKGKISQQDLQMTLGAAKDRHAYLSMNDERYQQRLNHGHTISGFDRFSHWFTKNYIWLVLFFLLMYVGTPFLAPVFMKAGLTLPARVIYTIYSPLCHQFAFRSWFLFGEQAYYPRDIAEIPGVKTYEQLVGEDNAAALDARAYTGDQTAGYKVALCERDVAIYGTLFLFGLIFVLTGRRIKPINIFVAIAIGLIPIAIDGVSQLPSIPMGLNIVIPDWVPMRESTPLLRTLTGALFGLMSAWIIFPMMEESMKETRQVLSHKIAVVEQTKLTVEK